MKTVEYADIENVRARVARSFAERARGLIGTRDLEPGEGLLILRCNAIHTFFMSFPIDATFLDADGNVVKTVRNIPPWRPFVWGGWRARKVLETKASPQKEKEEPVKKKTGFRLLLLAIAIAAALAWWFLRDRVTNAEVKAAVLSESRMLQRLVDERADALEERFDLLDRRIERIERKLDGIDEKLDLIIKMALPQLPADNLVPAVD